MSPILEWALHATKNKWVENNADERVFLVVFDIKRLRVISGVTLFRISNIIRFLEFENRMDIIDAQWPSWARNCDEYVTMGSAVKDAVVRMIPWFDLPSIPIVINQFVKAYTLAI